MNVEEYFKTNEYLIHPIQGTSMLPLLEEDTDLVKLKKNDGPLKLFDVVLFQRENGSLVLHRILKEKKGSYYIVGDNCASGEWVRKDQILAKAVGFKRINGDILIEDETYQEYVSSLEINPKKRKILTKDDTKTYQDAFDALIALIKEALGGETLSLDIRSWKAVCVLAKRHSVGSMVAKVAEKHSCPDLFLKKLQEMQSLTLRRSMLFAAERSKLLKTFEERQIKYLPLKGILLENLYPSRGMRFFSDNDILIEEKDAQRAGEILHEMGYSDEKLGIVHDSYYREPIYNFELHKSLFASYTEFFAYFKNVWDRAVPDREDGMGYHLNAVDFYVYNLAHFKKHYSNAGSGLKSFTDIYLLEKSFPEGDRELLKTELQTAGLTSFYEQVVSICEAFFGDSKNFVDAETKLFIQRAGTYGVYENSVKKQVKEKGKVGFFLNRLFMPYHLMVTLYPILKKLPFLLPFFWIVRVIDRLGSKAARSRIKQDFRAIGAKDD